MVGGEEQDLNIYIYTQIIITNTKTKTHRKGDFVQSQELN